MTRPITEIELNEFGDETHESWIRMRANRVTGGPVRLFDSEIDHYEAVYVEIVRCSRRRELNHDRLYDEEMILRAEMSMAQWGAFVSSFGNGAGVPATLRFLGSDGVIPEMPRESRLGESLRDVRESGDKATEKIRKSMRTVEEVFESGGRKALRAALRDLHFAIEHLPANMEFAAKSLVEHAENVVTKARADVEAMVLMAPRNAELSPGEARAEERVDRMIAMGDLEPEEL